MANFKQIFDFAKVVNFGLKNTFHNRKKNKKSMNYFIKT